MPGGVAELCLGVADHGWKKEKRRKRRGGRFRGKPDLKGHDTDAPDGAETEPDIPQLRPETDAEPDPGKPLFVRLKDKYVSQHGGQLTSADDEPEIAEPGRRRRRINRSAGRRYYEKRRQQLAVEQAMQTSTFAHFYYISTTVRALRCPCCGLPVWGDIRSPPTGYF